MNLRVDIILPSEKRSGSPVNPKFLVRLLIGIVPVAVGIYIAIQVISAGYLARELSDITQRHDNVRPQQEKAKALIVGYQADKVILTELGAWTNSRVAWSRQLSGLMRAIPENVQLKTLTISQTLQLTTNQLPVRLYAMTLGGRAVSADAEHSVRLLESRLRDEPPFAAMIDTVAIPSFGLDTSEKAARDDRVFQLTCTYAGQVLK